MCSEIIENEGDNESAREKRAQAHRRKGLSEILRRAKRWRDAGGLAASVVLTNHKYIASCELLGIEGESVRRYNQHRRTKESGRLVLLYFCHESSCLGYAEADGA